MSLLKTPIARLDGSEATLVDLTGGRPALLVNVASKCGYTDQYATLEQVHARFADRGFTVVGVPCNQFGGQEPGTHGEIAEFCSTTYGVTFPMTEKVDVTGEERHEMYDALIDHPDERGRSGDVRWNFEKFLVDPHGKVVARFSTQVVPDDPRVVDAIEDVLGCPAG